MSSAMRRLMWAALTSDVGNFLVSWVATWPLGLYQQYVTRSPAWLCAACSIALYLCVRRALPSPAEAQRRLARLKAGSRRS